MTTHSPVFADMTRFRSLRLVRKASDGAVSSTRVVKDDIQFLDEELDKERLTQYFNADSAEVLFSRGALLVEGHGDRLAALEVASKLELDLDAEGLSIVACGGKNTLPFYARSCRSLGIPFVVLHDTDIYTGEEMADWQEKETKAAPAANSRIRDAAGAVARILTVDPTLEDVLGIGRSASNKPMRVLQEVRTRNLDQLPEGLVEAVKALPKLLDAETQPS